MPCRAPRHSEGSSIVRARLGVVRLLGFELVDVALFLADGKELVGDPTAVTSRLRASLATHELGSEDLFLSVGATVEEIAAEPA